MGLYANIRRSHGTERRLRFIELSGIAIIGIGIELPSSELSLAAMVVVFRRDSFEGDGYHAEPFRDAPPPPQPAPSYPEKPPCDCALLLLNSKVRYHHVSPPSSQNHRPTKQVRGITELHWQTMLLLKKDFD